MSAPLELSAFQPSDLALPVGGIAAHGITIRREGRIIAMGGLVRVGAHWWTFAKIEPDGRLLLLHRLVMQALRAADEIGLTPIYGYCDETKPRALEWIRAMGFRLAEPAEKDADIEAVERWCGRPAWIRGARN